MQKSLLKEDFHPEDWSVTPVESEFVFISEEYINYRINGVNGQEKARLEQAIGGEVYAPARLMIVASLLGWKDVIKFLKEQCSSYDVTSDQLKAIIQYVKTTQQQYLEAMYEKYCEPALETVARFLRGESPSFKTTRDKLSFIVRYMAKNKAAGVSDTIISSLDANTFEYLEAHEPTGYYIIAKCHYDEPQSKWKLIVSKSPFWSGQREVLIMEAGQGWDKLLNKLNIYFNAPDSQLPEYEDLIQEAFQGVSGQDLTETIEKHEELNPALFTSDGALKPEIKDKVNEIVNEFLKDFIEVDVKLDVKDIILTGSNASYNYTKDSDLDIHIIADTSKIEDTLNLHKVIYNAYKSAFNRKFEIELNKVPVEIYVETQETPLVSNGIYSVLNDEWVKEPTKEDIPEVDQEAIDKAFKPWEKRYKALVAQITDDTDDEAEIDKFIENIYELRQQGLSTEGEYSIGNLVFKEVRNNGYLDDLKELRHKVIARRLSLVENLEDVTDYFTLLNKLM